MRFGIFMAPFHAATVKNPVSALARDIETIKLLDRLGYEEAWIGEHHSCGTELIASPEVFIANVAAQTSSIRLGTGVVSLPYHNPLWVADRAILLDYLTRGRFMLGLGPGALPTDAHMIGLDPIDQRGALEEDTDILLRLIHGDEPVSAKTARYELREAMCQLRPYSDFDIGVAAIASPTGPRIAGAHGLSILSVGATLTQDVDMLGYHWDIAEERAAAHGTTMDRDGWRLVGPMYIAETREQAYRDVEHGLDAWFHYLQHVAAVPHFEPGGATFTERIDWVNTSGVGVIGTPDDAIRQIETLEKQSAGGFGAYLMMAHEWANPSATARHYELFAEAVAPHFQHRTDRLATSVARATSQRTALYDRQGEALEEARARHAAETGAAG